MSDEANKDTAAKQNFDKPIWHSPVWLTAIVGVISAFFTIPDVIGNYLTKK